jgi:hypothetical protein
MTEADWLRCSDPKPMLAFRGGKAGDRKLRLFACACCRGARPFLRSACARRATEFAEWFADGFADRQGLVRSWEDHHLSARGYEVWADGITPRLKELVGAK